MYLMMVITKLIVGVLLIVLPFKINMSKVVKKWARSIAILAAIGLFLYTGAEVVVHTKEKKDEARWKKEILANLGTIQKLSFEEQDVLEIKPQTRKRAFENVTHQMKNTTKEVGTSIVAQTFINYGTVNVGEGSDYSKIRSELSSAAGSLGSKFMQEGKTEESLNYFKSSVEHDPTAQNYVLLGQCYVVAGEQEQAMESFKKAEQLDPGYAGIFTGRGIAFLFAEKFDLAKEEFEKAIEKDPKSIAAYGNLAYLYEKIGKYDKALEFDKKAVELAPDNALLHNNLGRVYEELNRQKEAEREYLKAIELHSDKRASLYAHANLGQLYWRGGNIDKAVIEFEKDKAVEPSFADAYLNIGVIYYEVIAEYVHQDYRKTGNFSPALPEAKIRQAITAVKNLRKAIELWADRFRMGPNQGPDSIFIEAQTMLVRLLYLSGKHSELVDECTRLLEKQPDNLEVLELLAIGYKHIGKHEHYVKIWEKMYNLAPNHKELRERAAAIHAERGFKVAMDGDVEKALNYLKKSEQIDPSLYLSHLGLGMIYLESDVDLAISHLKKAVELNLENQTARCYLGQAYAAKGKFREAIELIQKAIDEEPTRADFYAGLAQVYFYSGRLNDYFRTIEKMLEVDPKVKGGHFDLGVIAMMKGNFDEAVRELKLEIKLNPSFVKAYINLGGAYSQLGRFEEAVEQYKKALEVDPKTQLAHYNLATIYIVEHRMVDQAIEEFKKEIEVSPKLPSVYKNLSLSYAEKGDIFSSKQAWEKYAELDPERAKRDFPNWQEYY